MTDHEEYQRQVRELEEEYLEYVKMMKERSGCPSCFETWVNGGYSIALDDPDIRLQDDLKHAANAKMNQN